MYLEYGCTITSGKKVTEGYSGSDISRGKASTVEDCALKCSVTQECDSYHFWKQVSKCTLRKGGTKLSKDSGFSGGFCPKGKGYLSLFNIFQTQTFLF